MPNPYFLMMSLFSLFNSVIAVLFLLSMPYYALSQTNIKYQFLDRVFESGDTLRLTCEEAAIFNDSISKIDICIHGSLDGIRANTSRRGNRKRPRTRNPEDYPIFIENWQIEGISDPLQCALIPDASFTLLIFDTIAPIIHLFPDENGQVTAFLEDCDEAWIREIKKDTQFFSPNYTVFTTFIAEDYAGNTSTLRIEQNFNGTLMSYYADIDGDGFGNPDLLIDLPNALPGFVENNLDCNDDNPFTYPGSTNEKGTDCLERVTNDICSRAIDLKARENYTVFDFHQSTPTIYPPLPNTCGFPKNYRDVWFKTKVSLSGKIKMNFFGDGPPAKPAVGFNVEVFSGTCNQLYFLDCLTDDDVFFEKLISNYGISFDNLEPDSYLFLRVMEAGNMNTIFDVLVKDPVNIPENNTCDGAIRIFEDDFCSSKTYNNRNAVFSPTSFTRNWASCPIIEKLNVNDIWFVTIVPPSGNLTFEIEAVEGNTYMPDAIQILGDSCENNFDLGCSGSSVTLDSLTPGEDLLIRILEINGQEGDFNLRICNDIVSETSVATKPVDFKIFPNPASTNKSLFIELDNLKNKLEKVRLLDLQGRIIKEIVATEGPIIIIETTGIPTGTYFLQVQSKIGLFIQKVVIMD